MKGFKLQILLTLVNYWFFCSFSSSDWNELACSLLRISIRACSISSTDRGAQLENFPSLKISIAFRTSANVRKSRFDEENLVIWITSEGSVEGIESTCLFCLTSKSVCLEICCCLGQFVESWDSQVGPFDHNWNSLRLGMSNPREAQSAGLSAVQTWFHWLGGKTSWICETLLATKQFHRLGKLEIHANTIVESVQATLLLMTNPPRSKAMLVAFINLLASRAAHNSSRGRLTDFTGATLVFDASNFVSMLSLVVIRA